jgi:hypothetical protein
MVMAAEASFHAVFSHCTAKYLSQAGIKTDFVRLQDKGIHGNGHVMMIEKNNAERRAGQRHWPVIPGDPGIGPTARRATGCGVPHQRLSALRFPSHHVRGERLGKPRAQKRAARTMELGMNANRNWDRRSGGSRRRHLSPCGRGRRAKRGG